MNGAKVLDSKNHWGKQWNCTFIQILCQPYLGKFSNLFYNNIKKNPQTRKNFHAYVFHIQMYLLLLHWFIVVLKSNSKILNSSSTFHHHQNWNSNFLSKLPKQLLVTVFVVPTEFYFGSKLCYGGAILPLFTEVQVLTKSHTDLAIHSVPPKRDK